MAEQMSEHMLARPLSGNQHVSRFQNYCHLLYTRNNVSSKCFLFSVENDTGRPKNDTSIVTCSSSLSFLSSFWYVVLLQQLFWAFVLKGRQQCCACWSSPSCCCPFSLHRARHTSVFAGDALRSWMTTNRGFCVLLFVRLCLCFVCYHPWRPCWWQGSTMQSM